MPYTVACHHHADDHTGRHPGEWEAWQDAAQEICDLIESLAERACPPLNGREALYVLKVASDATRTGVAVLPGLVTYRVIDVTDAPGNDDRATGQAGAIDWNAVGRLARQAQRHLIELNHRSAVATAEDPAPTAGAALPLISELSDCCGALNALLQTPGSMPPA